MSRNLPAILALAALLPLTACGERTELRPKAGRTLPVAPYGRVDKPSPTELLAHTPTARPVLTIELHQRSEERTDDAFNLPPKE